MEQRVIMLRNKKYLSLQVLSPLMDLSLSRTLKLALTAVMLLQAQLLTSMAMTTSLYSREMYSLMLSALGVVAGSIAKINQLQAK